MTNCEKIGFENALLAKIRMGQIKLEYTNSRLKKVYRCPECKMWHLASKKKPKGVRNKIRHHNELEAQYYTLKTKQRNLISND